MKSSIRLILSHLCGIFYCVFTYVLKHDSTFYSSDPPEVSVENIATPAVEYTTRNLICRISGGNPPDPRSYQYKWIYRPTYCDSATDIPPHYGMC